MMKYLLPGFVSVLFVSAVYSQSDKPVLNKEYTTSSGLKYTFIQLGKGEKVQAGDRVTTHYIGKFDNDSVFDDTYKTGMPFTFKVGEGQAIPGYLEAVKLMRQGDKANIYVPAALAYGASGAYAIPPGANLKFQVEIVEVKKGPQPFNVAKKDTVKLPSGVKFIEVVKGKGPEKLSTGDLLTINYSGYLPDGKMFNSSFDMDKPFRYRIGNGLKGLDEAMLKLKKGSKARVVIPYMLAFGEQGVKGAIPPKTDVIYDVEILEVVKPFETKGKDTVTTASGLKYIVVSKAMGGAQAAPGKTVKVHYTGFLTDGMVFDSSIERDQPIEFVLGQTPIIKGWEEGIALMNVGDKIRFIIPSHLGYGDMGQPQAKIPPKATLLFDVELVEVK
ncbi:MAG: FKBP-type peptidyl-prolyl cis-trans isomerase [Bacteroidota bacterium]